MTYRRVIADILSVEALEGLMANITSSNWIEAKNSLEHGRENGARDNSRWGNKGNALIGNLCPRQGLVIAQAEVERKENEIVVAPQVLSQVNLAGTIVIADALHTQKGMCRQVVESGGDYVLRAKNNQARTQWAIEKLFVTEVVTCKEG